MRYFVALANPLDQYALHISSWYPTVKHPSLGNFVRRHIQSVAQHEKTILIHPVPLESLYEMELVVEEEHGFLEAIVYYPQVMGSGALLSFYRKLKAIKLAYEFGLQKLIKKHGAPKLIHAHIAYPHGYFAHQLAKKLSIPYLITEHWTGYNKQDGDYIRSGLVRKYLSKRIFRGAAAVLPVSAHLGNNLKAHKLIKKFQVVPNVVDTNTFSAGLKENSTYRFIHVSNLRDRQKNLSALMQAFGKLKSSQKKFELVLIGEERNADLDQMILQNKLTDEVHFELQLNEHEVGHQMKSADSFVLFSYFENLPCVLIEALSCGTKIISTSVGGIPEFFTGIEGVDLLEAGDNESLLAALEKHMEHKPEDQERKGRHAIAEQYFGMEAVGSQLIEIYKNLRR